MECGRALVVRLTAKLEPGDLGRLLQSE
jgi:hypothetical protein